MGARSLPQGAGEGRLIGIVAALGSELRALGPLASRPDVRVVRCGVGEVGARRAAERLADAGAGSLLVWGVAGALVDGLGECLVVPAEVVAPGGSRYAMDVEWHDAVTRRLGTGGDRVVTGALATAGRAVGSTAERRELAARAGAVAVDMEASAVAEVARRRGLPCLTVRAVADTLDTPWPAALSGVGQGRVWQARVLAAAVAGVSDWPAWPALARAHRSACARLRRAAERLAEEPGLRGR